jgi:S1-C subfamily serine protease
MIVLHHYRCGLALAVLATLAAGASAPPDAPARKSQRAAPDAKRRGILAAQPSGRGPYASGRLPSHLALAEPREHYRPPDVLRGESGEDLYAKCVEGIVYLCWPAGPNETVVGSGSVIDAAQRLVLTAAHVVKGAKTVSAYFPKWADDHVELDPSSKAAGRVVKCDLSLDLAVVQLESLPAKPTVLPLAARGARPGAEVACIGHPAGGARWSFNLGNVRNVEDRQWQSDSGFHKARVLLLQNPINAGDSGGPILNRSGEIVGVNHGKTVKLGIDLMSCAIALDEVRAFIRSVPGRTAGGAERALPDIPPPLKGPQLKVLTK